VANFDDFTQICIPIIAQFIAAHNANDVFREYLEKGIFKPRRSVQTDSNAMDVGNPSNFARVQNIFDNNVKDIRNMMTAYSFTDQQMKNAIKRVYKDLGYLCDPHGAIRFLAAEKYLKQKESENKKAGHVVFLETAHAAKFGEVVAPLIGQELAIPAQLQPFLQNQEKLAKAMSSDFQEFKEFLMGI
jgi:threonine synthase